MFKKNNISLIANLQHVRQTRVFLQKECQRRGLQITQDSIHFSKDKLLETIQAFKSQFIDNSIKNIDKSLLAIDLKSARNSIVMICSRQSRFGDEKVITRSKIARKAIEKALKNDQIFSRIAATRIFQSHRVESLRSALSTYIRDQRSSRFKDFLKLLQQAFARIVVYLIIIGIEALTFDKFS